MNLRAYGRLVHRRQGALDWIRVLCRERDVHGGYGPLVH